MKIQFFAMALILSGCVTTSDVVPVGKDSYLVSVSARGNNAGAGRIESAKAAVKYCAARGQHMIIRRTDTSGIALGAIPETTALVFSCVDESDPEWQRPNLQADPTVRIEDQRR
jgi:putative hemolysin